MAPTLFLGSQGSIDDNISSYQKSAVTTYTVWQTGTVASTLSQYEIITETPTAIKIQAIVDLLT